MNDTLTAVISALYRLSENNPNVAHKDMIAVARAVQPNLTYAEFATALNSN